MDFKQTRLSLTRPLTDYTKVQHLIAKVVRNRRAHINQAKVRAKHYLDIGCGPNTHEGFINLDYGWHPGIDICWDVTRGIPLPDAVVRGIFSEHCFEHLPAETIGGVLRECHRVLAPGGILRMVMPDGELYLTRYAAIVGGRSDLSLPYAENHSLDGLRSPIVTVNRIFRHHGHLFIYDFDILRQLLDQAGFAAVTKQVYGAGRDPRLLIDSEPRAIESFYVEASKPPARPSAPLPPSPPPD